MTFTPEQEAALQKALKEIFAERARKHAEATEVLALKITLEEPAFDGTFEILFMTREEADEWHKRHIREGRWATSQDVIEEVSFAEGVELAKRKDCSGGQHILGVARRFAELNPGVAALNLDI